MLLVSVISLVAVQCRTLTWLNLPHNELDSLEGIQTLTNLTGDSLYSGWYVTFTSSNLSHLYPPTVLNASCNAITTCGDLSSLKSKHWSHWSAISAVGAMLCGSSSDLKALILSSNQLSVLTGLSELKDLNTLGRVLVLVRAL